MTMDAVAAFLHRTLTAPAGHEARYKIRYSTLFWLFMLGSVVGFVLEGFWCILTKGHWEHHAATVWGPFCIIYGFGAVAIALLSALLNNKSLPVRFVAFAVSGAAVEYFGSLFQELCFGSVSWDYSKHVLNLGGRISLKMALMWGVLGFAFMRFAFPHVNRLLEKMKGRGWQAACIGMTVFMTVNLLVTCAAVTRWKARMTGAQASHPVAQWLDNTYDNQTMAKLFPNMQFPVEYVFPAGHETVSKEAAPQPAV